MKSVFLQLTLTYILLTAFVFSPVSLVLADENDLTATPVPWAYSVFQGMGVYDINGETIGMISLPLSTIIELNDDTANKLEIYYPVVAGFYDFELIGKDPVGIKERLGTISLVPGLHYHYQIEDNWILTPLVDAGVGFTLRDRAYAWIYSAGMEIRYNFIVSSQSFQLANRLRWAGYTQHNPYLKNSYSSVETILEYPIDASSPIMGRQVDFTPYISNQFFLDGILINSLLDQYDTISLLWEAGFTIGMTSDNEDELLRELRLGLGFRFGGGLKGIHIIFGDTF